MGVDADEVLDRARALVPRLRERARETERQRRISDETIAELIDAGLLRLTRPARYGGLEADANLFLRTVEILSTACASTGWATEP
jgi:3-hydroxy-9,10-secoandrosta-1,3,5(10)-triene-9,17-dione monooxygenase